MINKNNWWEPLIQKRQEESIGLIKVKNIISKDLYPDNAHFIYELLQNAEDTEATKVSFEVLKNKLILKHNGKRLFTQKDIEAITDINNYDSKEKKEERFKSVTIGKFGIGFKAVFAYTDTPKIHSGGYSFEIYDLVVPRIIEPISIENDETIMIFPFNSSEKNPIDAYEEIIKVFDEIQDNVLLFLTNIDTLQYSIENKTHTISREETNDAKVKIKNSKNNSATEWLRFKKYLEISLNQFVSVAFKLEIDKKSKQEIIIPINGQVSIFFPAEKETSNLKFHIHAPFDSTVARDSLNHSIKINEELRDLIAELICKSLEYLKINNLLDFNFLKCLPIEDDNLSPFYWSIQYDIVDYFKDHDYVLTDNEIYKPASQCYKSINVIKDIVDIDLLKDFIHLDEEEVVKNISWAKNPSQKNSREEKFLQSLDIKDFKSFPKSLPSV